MKNLLFIIGLCLIYASHADDWTHLATCIAPSGDTGGADLYSDGTELILQIARIDESMDEYRTNLGHVTQHSVDIAQLQTDLSDGTERFLNLTKATSTEAEDVITNAALFVLKAHSDSSREENASVSRRGKLMRLACSLPSTTGVPTPERRR